MTDSAPATNTPATSTPANNESSMQQKLVDVKLESQNPALNVMIIYYLDNNVVFTLSKNLQRFGNASACFNNLKLPLIKLNKW